jgi:hypothetical protein
VSNNEIFDCGFIQELLLLLLLLHENKALPEQVHINCI